MAEASSGALPLHCLDLENTQNLGVRCPECPLAESDCQPLAAGRLILTQQATIEDLGAQVTDREAALAAAQQEFEVEKSRILERLFNLRIDTLVETAFTPEGLKDHLIHDTEIQAELRQMRWGIIRLDGRFVNYINRFGNMVGDDFLQRGGAEITAITDGLARLRTRRLRSAEYHPERRQIERRAGFSIGHEDIICRQGGDEFTLLIRNVDTPQLASIAGRVQSRLTVPFALERYSEGQVPFIASVGFAHATDKLPEVTRAFTLHDDWGAFRVVNGFADEGQRQVKSEQYEEMWRMVCHVLTEPERNKYIAQPDDRVVAELFLERLCPDFQRNPIAFLMENS